MAHDMNKEGFLCATFPVTRDIRFLIEVLPVGERLAVKMSLSHLKYIYMSHRDLKTLHST